MSLLTLFQLNLESTPTAPYSVSDTLAVNAVDAAASIHVSILTSDTVQPGLVESSLAFVNVTADEALTAVTPDSSVNIFIVDSITVVDAIACAADDQAFTVLTIASVAASDAAAIGCADSVTASYIQALTDDAVVVQSGEMMLADVSLQSADSCAISLSSDAYTGVMGVCADSIGVTVTDAAAAQDIAGQQDIAVTDALVIDMAESISVYAELAVTDALVSELAESAVVPLAKTAQDDLVIAIAEDSSVSVETPEDQVYWNGSIDLEYAGACAYSYQIPCAGNDRNRW